MNYRIVLPKLALTGIAVISLACCSTRSPIDAVAAKINKTLPRPYVDGLVMEHAYVDNGRLITDIRIPNASVKQLNPAKLQLIRDQEQGDLDKAACADPALTGLLQRKVPVGRRFLDRDGKLVFEIVVSIPDCKSVQ